MTPLLSNSSLTPSRSKPEILAALAETLDVERLLKETPGLGREGLRKILLDASESLRKAVPVPPKEAEKPKVAPAPSAGSYDRLIMYTDGASRGNPGEAGAGVVIKDSTGKLVKELARYLGQVTNNQAEYAALILGLKAAHSLGAKEVVVHADSELMVKQMNGVYKVKNPDLKDRYTEASAAAAKFRRVVLKYVPREMNREADAMANKAIDDKVM